MVRRGIEETVDHVAITRLQRAYADIVNRRAWAELGDVFAPDVTIDLDLVTRPPQRLAGAEAFAAFVGPAMARFSFFEFVILNSHVELWPQGVRTEATARVFMCELRQAAGETERTDAFGFYRDRYVLLGDDWRIASRRYRSLGRFPPGETFPLPADLDA